MNNEPTDEIEDIFVEMIDLENMIVVGSDGASMPIICIWDEDYIEVGDIEEAAILLCGSPDQGYYEFEFDVSMEPVTIH